MKKTIFILITLIALLTSCSKSTPLDDYADKIGVELIDESIVTERQYCAIDSIYYYINLVNKKSNELSKKVMDNPDISNDSIIKYRKYGFITPDKGKPNSTAYYGLVKGTTKIVGIYVMDDGRVVSFETERYNYISLQSSQISFIKFVDGLIE